MSESTAPPPPPASANSNRTLMLVLSYLGLLCLIPLLTEKDDREVQWHAKHGLVFFLFFVAVFVLLSVLGAVPAVGCLTIFMAPFAGLAWMVVTILAIVKAVNGQRFKIPGISDFADKF